MKGLGITEAMTWGKVCYYGVSIPQGVTANRDDDKEKQKTTERWKKEITLKKKGRKGNTSTLQKKSIYGGTGQEMDSICISKKSLVFTYILKDFQPVLLGEIKKEEKAGQGEN